MWVCVKHSVTALEASFLVSQRARWRGHAGLVLHCGFHGKPRRRGCQGLAGSTCGRETPFSSNLFAGGLVAGFPGTAQLIPAVPQSSLSSHPSPAGRKLCACAQSLPDGPWGGGGHPGSGRVLPLGSQRSDSRCPEFPCLTKEVKFPLRPMVRKGGDWGEEEEEPSCLFPTRLKAQSLSHDLQPAHLPQEAPSRDREGRALLL